MDETEFQSLLQRAEPVKPAVDRSAIVDALTTAPHGHRPRLNIERQSAYRPLPRLSGRRKTLAVCTMSLAIAAVMLATIWQQAPISRTSAEQMLAEYRQTQAESEALKATLQQLIATSEPILPASATAEIRASESLWLLLQADTSDQRTQAQTIVTLYANTPAASRCRQMFPDIVVQ
ncbi:MAG: hypothetical protein NXI04_14690 [Planctomycetaceae bacterium]|nr:hypothetical protein [Planctomycetaceae bacterium]